MLKSVRRWCAKSPRVAVSIGVGCALAGVYLGLMNFRKPAPADPAVDAGASAAFVASDRFAQLSSQQREEYLRTLSVRYVGGSPDVRREMEAGLSAGGADPAMIRARGRDFALAMVRSILEGYETLTPEQRQARIAALRMFSRAMGFRSGTAAALDPTSRPVSDATAAPESFRKGLGQFERDILESFSAEQRSTLSKLAADIKHGAPARKSD